ncbi:hypothetical protein EMGBS4_11270 [Acidimicrobiaceae bacterium]|nr:hypothetical protein EMGBS4_11270 [Acidimicrobiaceae bacterium]
MAFSSRNAVLTMSGTKLKDVTGPEVPTSFILIVPLFHVTGCVPVMMSCFIAGLKLAIMYKWDAEKALEMIEREQITNFRWSANAKLGSRQLARRSINTIRQYCVRSAAAERHRQLRWLAKSTTKSRTAVHNWVMAMTETNASALASPVLIILSHPTSTWSCSFADARRKCAM